MVEGLVVEEGGKEKEEEREEEGEGGKEGKEEKDGHMIVIVSG